jgi:integrase
MCGDSRRTGRGPMQPDSDRDVHRVDDGYLMVNPARIRGAGQTVRRHQVRPATLDELAALTLAMPPRYRLLIQLVAFCALRFGELTELRRADIDTTRGVIMVRRAVVLANGALEWCSPRRPARRSRS